MRLITSDYGKTVDVGTGTIWYSLYSTVMLKVPDSTQAKAPMAVSFLKNGEVTADNTLNTVKQLAVVIAALREIKPEDAVLDWKHPEKNAPWKGHISKDVSSCADLYKTADGKDLLSEVVDLLKYAEKNKLSVSVS